MMKTTLLFILISFSFCLNGQLEAEILPEGIIFPRMNTVQRNAITPITGQCIYNFDTGTLECFDGGSNWRALRYNWITDSDGDTFVTAEFVGGENWIRMNVKGQQALWVKENNNGQLILEPRYQAGNDIIGSGGTGLNIDPALATNNTLIGAAAGANIVSGDDNVAVGSGNSASLTSGNFNTSMGKGALLNLMTADHNTAIGFKAGENLSGNSTFNTIVGSNTLTMSSNASQNIAIGGAMSQSTVNVIGNGPLNNVAIGQSAMNTSEAQNSVAIGGAALLNHQDGTGNVAVGSDNLTLNINGSRNTSVGFGSLFTTTGSFNTGLGHGAGQFNDGSRNVFIGNQAGSSTIGDDKLVIANSSTKSLISGDFATDQVHINSILTLELRSTPPASPVTGMIYMDDGACCGGVPTLRVYTNGNWHDL